MHIKCMSYKINLICIRILIVNHIQNVGGRKVFLSTNEICVGLEPKLKLDSGLEARPKGYQ